MEHIHMSLDFLAIFTMLVGTALFAANTALLVARLMHKDRFVRESQRLLANVVWIFRLGGGRYHGRRHHLNGGT